MPIKKEKRKKKINRGNIKIDLEHFVRLGSKKVPTKIRREGDGSIPKDSGSNLKETPKIKTQTI